MKKIILFFVLIFLCGCADVPPAAEIRVYLPANYINHAVLEEFQRTTGVKVLCDIYSTHEEMFENISTKKDQYDIVITQDHMITRLALDELILPIDSDQVPNLINLDIEGTTHSVPYLTGVLGILYNKDMVSEPITSWDSLWDSQYAQQIIMPDNRRDCFSSAFSVLGFSPDSGIPAEIDEAQQKLIAQRRLVQGYYDGGIGDRMVSRRATLALTYSGEAWYAMQRNENLTFIVPETGSHMFTASFSILKDTKAGEISHQFINFMCDDSAATLNQSALGYSSANATARTAFIENLPENCVALTYDAEKRRLIDYAWSRVHTE